MEHKIEPVLTDKNCLDIWMPFREFPVDWIAGFARAIEQAVLARVGAVRDQALLRLMPEVLASLRADGMNVSLVADLERALKGTPAAAVADGEYRRGLMEAFHRANMTNANRQGRTAEETCAQLVRCLGELANGSQPSGNPGPLAAVELPPLPSPDLLMPWRINAPDGSVHGGGFTIEQMREYARAAIAASKEGASHG